MPHEVDMTKVLIMSLKAWWAEESNQQPVRSVILQVGDFTCVEPDLLVSSFAQQRLSVPFLQQAKLVIRQVPFVAYCRFCSQDYRPDLGLHYACPTCHAPLHDIRSGRELKIERVEWALEIETVGD
jgi:hydrogenase nickel incorporation protein HypA/HybF